MRALLPYILALCCLLSCTTPADVTPLLEQAEQLMNVRPDSALTLLESIPEPEELSKRHRARWGLLLTQACDKNYVSHTSDSLITTVIDYYRTHDAPLRLAWAYYYDGIIHYELEEFELSQAALLKAEEAGAKVADFDLLGRIYENLGTIYRKQGLTDLVLPMHRKALDAKLKVGDSLGIGLAYNNIGKYYLSHDMDSAEYYLKYAVSWLQYEPYRQSNVLNDLGRLYKVKNKYREALEVIKQSLILSGSRIKYVNHRYLNMAEVYDALGQQDSAIHYLKYCLNDSKTRTTAHKRLADIYSQKSEYQKAYLYKSQYALLLDSVHRSEKAVELANQLEKHKKEKAIAQLKQAHAESKFWGLAVGTVMIVTLLAIALILTEKNRRKKGELLRVSREMASTQQKYQQMMSDKKLLEANHQSVCEQLSLMKQHHAIFESHVSHLQQLKEDIELRLKKKEAELVYLTRLHSVQLKDLGQHCLESSSIYNQIKSLIGKKREVKDFKFKTPHEQDWTSFYFQIDFVYGEFVTRLREGYKLKDEYLNLACFILLDIHPCNIKKIYTQTIAAITNRRTALADKLGVPIDELDIFLHTFSKLKNSSCTFEGVKIS